MLPPRADVNVYWAAGHYFALLRVVRHTNLDRFLALAAHE